MKINMRQSPIETKSLQSHMENVDLKLITFQLSGKDYGIDILVVKGVAQVDLLTAVPNTPPFVSGVYNLRGEVISVVDLRTFLNLTPHENENSKLNAANMIVLNLETGIIGVLVDSISQVLGIFSEDIKPPHPIFKGINVDYIKGIIEKDKRLYIILDFEKILTSMEEYSAPSDNVDRVQSSKNFSVNYASQELSSEKTESVSPPAEDDPNLNDKTLEPAMFKEALAQLKSFYVSPVNDAWFETQLDEWGKKKIEDLEQFETKDAEDFLSSFSSPCSDSLWNAQYMESVAEILPPDFSGPFTIWNPGCAAGHETYSIACMIKKRMPSVQLRIFANDNNLELTAIAPGLKIDSQSVDPLYEEYLVDAVQGKQFNNIIKDSIFFEYGDVTQESQLPRIDLVVMRDTISFLSEEQQISVFSSLEKIMKPNAVLLLGSNEKPLNVEDWLCVDKNGVNAYKIKRSR